VDVERARRSTAYFENCTYSSAEFLSKKSLNFAQNLENKGPAIFLPRRSMVLKVVTGKIFKTLGLARGLDWLPTLPDNSKAADEGFRLRLVGRTQQLAYVVNTMAKSCDLVRLSKNAVIL
jgi:hypothetical protein